MSGRVAEITATSDLSPHAGTAIRFKEPEAEGEEWANYNPSESFEEEEKEREHAKLEAELEEAHQESLEAARKRPPPETVSAYRAVFSHDPLGWPPWE